MVISIHIITENAAFENYPEEEVARILRALADRIIKRGLQAQDSINLKDYNGNTVGSYTTGEEEE